MGKPGLLGASTIYLFAFVCLGVGLVANSSFHNYVKAISQVISGFIDDFGVAGLGILEFVTKARKDLLSENFDVLLRPLDDSMDMAEKLQQGVRQGISDAKDVISGVDKAITVVFAVLIIVFLLMFIGLLLLFSSGVRGNVRRRLAKAIYLVPLLLAWVTVGIATSTGAVLGDMCFVVADYQKMILVEKGMLPQSVLEGMNTEANPMSKTQLTCPENLVSSKSDLELLKTGINGVDQALKFADGIGNASPEIQRVIGFFEAQIFKMPKQEQTVMNSGVGKLSDAVSWVKERLDTFLECDPLAQLLARLNAYLCGSRQTIMVVFSIWLSLFILAILLSVMLILASFTRFNPAMFVTPRWVATEKGTYVMANKKLVISPSEFSPYFNATAPAPASFMTVNKTAAGDTEFVSKV